MEGGSIESCQVSGTTGTVMCISYLLLLIGA